VVIIVVAIETSANPIKRLNHIHRPVRVH